ncbi:DUF6080 domain-containing protein [Microseira sp. BLCC-F43]|jgi:hypothetical protein|uniref:DUF6080 domain-containing protein n=1 Tax=Microseira sp. BLCC-F43 TaxID=3153602 RepID=UPI0035BC1972
MKKTMLDIAGRYGKLPVVAQSIKSRIAAINNQARKHWPEILLVVAIATLAGIAFYQGSGLIGEVVVRAQRQDMWFEADSARVFANMTKAASSHYRTKVHPLFSLIAFPPVYLVKTVLGIKALTAVRLVIAAIAGLWVGALFILLRLIGCLRLDATLFSILGATSASAMFWFVVPETYSFGSLTMIAALCLVAIAQYRKLSARWYVVVSALTLSITTTNWMAGIAATFTKYRRKRAWQITVNAFCLVVLLWGVQKFIFPSAEFFIGDREERSYIYKPTFGSLLQVLQSFFAHTMVMPAIQIAHNNKDWSIMLTQRSFPGSASLWGSIAVVLWMALLGLGLWGFFSTRKHGKLRIVLGLTLLGQLALHAVYGSETFLYSLHFLPLLVVLAAWSTQTPARPIALVLAGMLVLTAGVNNSSQLIKATEFVLTQGSPRDQVLGHMQLRPTDPWPRGTGHVVLAAPGSREVDKAYHEPGGSFSPAVGSFGVSLWLTDTYGNLLTTSDRIPLSDIRQELKWVDGQDIPGILTQTSYYQAFWSSTKPATWTLNLKTQANATTKPMVVIRSVGPAGGAIRSLDWNGKRLLINDRWSVTLSTAPAKVYLGEEAPKGWMSDRSDRTQWQSENGWGYARFELADNSNTNLVIQDSNPPTPIKAPTVTNTRPALELNLPDKQFTASLNAQVAHLMMGIVGRETRPGEPTNYPLSWQRDGAYKIVALARAGKLQVAKELSTYFAENDFFGGFGAEADAPGLSIWALEEVAVRLNQPEYDKWLMPHVRRKAEFILKMLATKEPIRQTAVGPVVPKYQKNPNLTLVADPAKNGLIVGRMDWHRPLLFVNAVSYRGLLDAASLAERVGHPADAQRWRTKAAQLKKAWEKAFKPPESNNERTYINSLWPTWVATSHKDALLQRLQERWTKLRDAQGEFRQTPLWTYFNIAEAHQWLFLKQPERVWSTLRWFWHHQASPGLYTWWEGKGEENTFGRWERVRGWVKPPHVTPHYWTAAEMLLLQLDMLAYIDQMTNQPTLVIGAGIPDTWLKAPMQLRGLPMPNGQIDWNWDGKQMQVKLSGKKVNVRLGAAFPPNTPLKVEYLDLQSS